MSDTLPNEVREAAIGKVANAVWAECGFGFAHTTAGLDAERMRCDRIAHTAFNAALSALETAGFEVNRKGTREALGEAVAYADGVSWAEGMPIDKQAGRLTFYCTTDDGAEYEGVWDVAKARALLTASNPKEKPDV